MEITEFEEAQSNTFDLISEYQQTNGCNCGMYDEEEWEEDEENQN